MTLKKQIHEAQTDLMPVKKTAADYSADDVRLILKNLTLRNMKALESKIPTASIMEHKIIQEAINAALKGADVVPYYPNQAAKEQNETTIKVINTPTVKNV